MGIRRNPTLPRQPDSENPTAVQETDTMKGPRPVTVHGDTLRMHEEVETTEVEGQPAITDLLSKPELRIGQAEEIMEEVRADPRLPKAVHFPYP